MLKTERKLGKKIQSYLKKNCSSEPDAVSARALSARFGIKERDLRNYIHDLRQKGCPVCSSCKGYWYSTNPEDIKKTLKTLIGWKKGLDEAVKALRRVAKDNRCGGNEV